MPLRPWLPLAAALLLLGLPETGLATTSEGAVLKAVIEAAEADDWDRARGLASRSAQAEVLALAEWLRLRKGRGSWEDYARFLAAHPDWPGLELIRAKAEVQMPAGLAPAAVTAFFANGSPSTGAGAYRLARALSQSGRDDEARAEVVRAWTSLTMSVSERAAFQTTYGGIIDDNHWNRTDAMLWSGRISQAEAMLPTLSSGGVALARARIALQRDEPGVDTLIEAVPARLQDDPGLAFDRMNWRIRKGRWLSAETVLLEQSASADTLGEPARWGDRRRSLAREAMRDGRVHTAYRLASRHFLDEGSDYADLEWLSGYVALTRLNDPALAVGHFTKFRDAVKTPISLGRAGYWLGRAEAAAGHPDAARAAYTFGARHQSSFYGQLAAAAAGLDPDPALARTGGGDDWSHSPLMESSVVRAALLLRQAGLEGMADRFLLHAGETLGVEDTIRLTRLALDTGRGHIAVRLGKRLAVRGVIAADAYYPVGTPALADQALAVEAPLALAVARQESELNPEVVSPAGARGLMQLMPRTAKAMAEAMGEEDRPARLTADAAYNARLGAGYLAKMLDRYDGSHVLAAAAYNAGPARVDSWIEANGDPRLPGIDPVDWIEAIPFRETQNYVMRVLEGVAIYRQRLGRPGASLTALLEVHEVEGPPRPPKKVVNLAARDPARPVRGNVRPRPRPALAELTAPPPAGLAPLRPRARPPAL